MRYNLITFILSYFADVSLNAPEWKHHLRIHLYPLNYLIIIIIICWLIITQTPYFDSFDSAKPPNCVQRAIAIRACCYPFGRFDDAVEHRIDKRADARNERYSKMCIFRECWFSKIPCSTGCAFTEFSAEFERTNEIPDELGNWIFVCLHLTFHLFHLLLCLSSLIEWMDFDTARMHAKRRRQGFRC